MTPYLLDVKNLVLARNGRVLTRPFSFSLASGESIHLVGNNGSGKTTLLDTLATLSAVESGEIYWQGQQQKHVGDELRALWHYCGHVDALKKEWTLLENLHWQAKLMGLPFQTDLLKTSLHQMALNALIHVPVGQFSKGQQRRAALLRLVLFNRPLWLLDEPFSALDIQGAHVLVNWLDHHVANGGAVIFTTHQSYPTLKKKPIPLSLNDSR